jgi:hypothetical protein
MNLSTHRKEREKVKEEPKDDVSRVDHDDLDEKSKPVVKKEDEGDVADKSDNETTSARTRSVSSSPSES